MPRHQSPQNAGYGTQQGTPTAKKRSTVSHASHVSANGIEQSIEDILNVDVEDENADANKRQQKRELLFTLHKKYPDQLEFMRQSLKMLLFAIEKLNTRFKSPIHLNGWAAETTRDMSRFDKCLRGLYHMYFKRRQSNPLFDLGWLILTSGIVFHFQHMNDGVDTGKDAVEIPPPSTGFSFQNVLSGILG
jgi:hypothetical protein